MADQPIRVLLVEDALADATLIRDVLSADREAAFAVTHVERLAAAVDLLGSTPFDLILLDLYLPDSRDSTSLLTLQARAPQIPIVVLTVSSDKALAAELLRRGAQDYLMKSDTQASPHLLSRAIRYAIERKRVEEQLHQAHALHDQLLASLPSILIGISSDGRVTHWNGVAEATFGLPAAEVTGRPFLGCPIRWDAARIEASLRDPSRHGSLTRMDDIAFTRADGRPGVLGISIVPITGRGQEPAGFLLFGADITDRKHAEAERSRLEEQLNQSQKMETIGRVSGGIAHDFNNFLQVILGFTWLIRSRYRNDTELLSDVQEIVHAAESASGMVRQLLAFSRRQPLQPKVFDINTTIGNMARLVQQFIGERIQLTMALAPAPLLVKLDPTGLEQIVMNLCSNARDSMLEGGVLTISTGRMTLDDAFVIQHTWGKRGEYVRLSIQDTGTGIEPSVVQHIFEPFFTTKPSGKGTGLGLAVVYGVVKQHEGYIDVKTAVGSGTMFDVYFPAQPVPAEAAPAGRVPAGAPSAPEAILLIEDTARQRSLDQEILTEAGYRVAATCDSAGAPEMLRQHGRRVDAVILELAGPGAAGQDLLRQIRTAFPAMKVLVIAPASDPRIQGPAFSGVGIHLLRKPYVPAYLLDRLRQALDQPAGGGSAEGTASIVLSAAKKSVLVVDDEPSILAFCERLLSPGCDVTVATTGKEALSHLTRQRFDLLLTDIKMPEMDGFALVQAAAKVRPDLKVVAMSGFLEDELEQRLRVSGLPCEVIRKPFSGQALQEMVSRCL